MHIAIAGNIGSGKTTLTKMLAAHYGWIPKFESVDFNPYLSDFYEDMARWSFNLQIYFLNKRFKDVVDISKTDDIIIQDRTIYEDARISTCSSTSAAASRISLRRSRSAAASMSAAYASTTLPG